MSKATEYIEKVRESWGVSNDGDGSGLDADFLDGLEKEELPISTLTQTELTRIDGELLNRTIGSWTFDGTTLSITGVPAP